MSSMIEYRYLAVILDLYKFNLIPPGGSFGDFFMVFKNPRKTLIGQTLPTQPNDQFFFWTI